MILIKDVNKALIDKKLFEIEKLYINENDKIALIGENGSGKTSLFRMILGLDSEYQGTIRSEKSIDYLLNDFESDERYFSHEIYSKAKLNSFEKYSPGEYQRLKLTELLADKSIFVLMDEPTSHLDIKQKEELVDILNNRSTGYFLISHDRDFINRTCNKILEISNGKVEEYNGNYTFYLEEKEKRKKFHEREYKNFIREKKRLENVAQKIKEQSLSIKTTPKRMGNSEARLHKMGGQGNKKKLDKQVNATLSRLNQLEKKEKPKEETEIKLTVPDNKKIQSKVLIKAEKLSKKFKNKILFENTDFIIENNAKIALLGDNGSGKTTLLKIILNKEDIWVHPNIKIGYFSQMNDNLICGKSISENIINTSIYDETLTRIILARLGFSAQDCLKTIEILSDGERAKVKLAKIITSDFNYLIMDEPTNFLDINTIESLEKLLKSYDRPIIFVSHDEEFINNIADKLLIIKNKKIELFNGNLKQYKNKKSNISKNNMDKVLIDFRLSTINSRMTMDISKEERAKLEEEYKELLMQKNN